MSEVGLQNLSEAQQNSNVRGLMSEVKMSKVKMSEVIISEVKM